MVDNVRAPALPLPPVEYDQRYFDQLLSILRLYFNGLDNPGGLSATSLHFDIDKLPTQADLSDLRAGDVYRDTSASNVLKVKT